MISAHIEMPDNAVAALCKRHGVRELLVFGSALRDDFGPDSDVDFLVAFKNGALGPWMAKLFALENELGQLLGRKADVTPKECLKWVVRDRILAEARVVYVEPEGSCDRTVSPAAHEAGMHP